MQIMKLNDATREECVAAANVALSKGGVILFPTDTLYGLGADALNDEAVAKIYEIKGRDEGKPIHGIVADMETVDQFAVINSAAQKIAHTFFPGPLTLILKQKAEMSMRKAGILKGIETIGIRIPNEPFCLELARAFGKPFTATSANKAGLKPESTLGKIFAQLGSAIALIDIAFDAGELPASKPSTVVDVSKGEVHILRDGAIPADKIKALDVIPRGDSVVA